MIKIAKALFWIAVILGLIFTIDVWVAEGQSYPHVNYAAYIYSSGSWAAADAATAVTRKGHGKEVRTRVR
jgi:hypothetical protein